MHKHPTLVIQFQPVLTVYYRQKIDPDSILQTKFSKQQESSILGYQPVI
jgi:hypothetical protein